MISGPRPRRLIGRSPSGGAGGSTAELATGRLDFRQVAVEDLALIAGEPPFDLAFAVRVGAFDGRHPAAGRRAPARLADVLTPDGRLLVDGGRPRREVTVPRTT